MAILGVICPYLGIRLIVWGIPEKIVQNVVRTHWPLVIRTPKSKVRTKSNFGPILGQNCYFEGPPPFERYLLWVSRDSKWSTEWRKSQYVIDRLKDWWKYPGIWRSNLNWAVATIVWHMIGSWSEGSDLMGVHKRSSSMLYIGWVGWVGWDGYQRS